MAQCVIAQGCTSSLPYAVMLWTGATICYIYRTVDTLSWYILMCYFCHFLSLHSLGTSNVFVSSSPQNIVILQIMYVSLLFDTVLYCLTYQLLSCCNSVVTVTETDGQQERVSSAGLVEGEEGFSKRSIRSKISNCIPHTVCWPCCT